MKRSRHVSLHLVPIVAAGLLAGCRPQRQACVGQDGRVVADDRCQGQPEASGSWDTNTRPTGSGFYHWYWYRGPSPVIGRAAPIGGSYLRPSSSGSVRGTTVRGGFGSTAAGHSSGGTS